MLTGAFAQKEQSLLMFMWQNYFASQVYKRWFILLMKRYGFIELSRETFNELVSSKEISVYKDKGRTFIEQREEITQFVILINENGKSFIILNEPFNDNTHWEIDRLSITSDTETEQTELTFVYKFLQPKMTFYREFYEVGSRVNDNEIDNVEADTALLIEDKNDSLFINCYDAASLELNYTREISGEYIEIDMKKFLFR